jgi:hypothetical protein
MSVIGIFYERKGPGAPRKSDTILARAVCIPELDSTARTPVRADIPHIVD